MKRFQRLGIGLAMPGLVLATTWLVPMPWGRTQVVPYANQLANRQVDVSELRSHLQAQNWQAADAETRRILQSFVHPNGDIFSEPLPTRIPAEVLQTIDQLWTEASNGRFGFSTQVEIWDNVRGEHPEDTTIAARAFGDRVGWTRPTPDPNNFVSPDWLTEPELTYSLEAPVGHLPWVGVDWSRIEAMLAAQSCGSCMIDAMYLQGERFGRYLPTLMGWATSALTMAVPPVGSWEQAQLVQSIDLHTLYPNNNCPVYTSTSAISPNGELLAISSYSYERSCSSANNSTLALWNTQQGTRRITLLRGQAVESWSYPGPPQEPETESTRIVGDVANAIAFTADGDQVAAGLSNGTIQLWTTDQGELVRTFRSHSYAVRAIAMSPDGQTLVSASADQTIKLWNLQTGELLRTIPMNGSDGIVLSLHISPDGQRLATATNRNTLQLWNAQTGHLIRTLVDEAIDLPPGMSVAFSPDGQLLATADVDHSIKLWNASNGARIITLKGHTERLRDLAFSPDGQFLASSDGTMGHLWNLQTYQPVHTFDLIQNVGHPIMPDNLGYVAFSRDSQTLTTSTLLQPLVHSEPIPQQGITLWDVDTGQSIHQIHDVAQFQFSPDGQFLMARGQKVQIWKPYISLILP